MVYLVNLSEEPNMYSSFTSGKLYPVDSETVTDDNGVNSNLYPIFLYELVIDL